ncbi:hypothetical protein GGD41_003585 [Paraburkholderia bryophila]|uniref:Uncharacterized protein n=1 Tax=Paraburkholderia bryophila TaxID=420952 RepID=A0A7Z0B1G1_9BURK|nr:hypothetical protein [Paraburkholderia bryophila]
MEHLKHCIIANDAAPRTKPSNYPASKWAVARKATKSVTPPTIWLR